MEKEGREGGTHAILRKEIGDFFFFFVPFFTMESDSICCFLYEKQQRQHLTYLLKGVSLVLILYIIVSMLNGVSLSY